MLVDVHAHIGISTPGAASPARVAEYAQACQIDFVLVSNRDAAREPHEATNLDEAEANLACLEACRQHPRLAALYWVRPGQPDSNLHALTGALRSGPFVGALFSPAESGYDAAARLLAPYLGALAKGGRPAVFCCSGDETAGPAKVYEQARRQPDLPVLICACGGAVQRAAALDVVGHARRRGDASLYVDTSHADAREIATANGVAGSEHVLFGSDALYYGDGHAARVAALLAELRNCLSAVDFENVTGTVAARLFRLTAGK